MTPRYTLHRGDALLVLPTLEPASFDAIIADPPYSSGGQYRGDRAASTRSKYVQTSSKHTLADFTGDNRDQRSFLAWSTLWMTHARVAAKPGAIVAVFTDWRQLPITTDAVQAAGWVWRGVGAWVKKTARPTAGRYRQQAEFVVWGTNGPRPLAGRFGAGAWTADTPRAQSRIHQTQKPEAVMRGLLEILEPGSAVLDPFVGSGTTGAVALAMGLDFTGIELDDHYHAVATQRLEAAAPSAATMGESPVWVP